MIVLALGKASEIEEVFNVLDKHEIPKEAVEKCLSVLVNRKASEIEENLNVLDKHKMPKEIVQNYLYVLKNRKSTEMEEIFNVLDEHKISKEKIEENYGIIFSKKPKEIKEVFMEKSDSNIILYIKLKGFYNKIIKKEEIKEVCNYKKISFNQFLKIVDKERWEDILQQTLTHKGSIYIGKSIPMTQEQMNKHYNIIIDISKKVSKSVSYKYHILDISELESNAVNCIVEKCGDIVYNTEINPEVMTNCIYSKCKKYLLGNYLENNRRMYSIDELPLGQQRKINDYSSSENSLDLQKWNLTKRQKEILKNLSDFIETGFNYQESLKNLSSMLDLDIEELVYEIEEIKENINERAK